MADTHRVAKYARTYIQRYTHTQKKDGKRKTGKRGVGQGRRKQKRKRKKEKEAKKKGKGGGRKNRGKEKKRKRGRDGFMEVEERGY